MRPHNLLGTALLTTALLSGCSFNAGYNSTYLPPAGITTKIDENILIVMSEQEQDWVYSGNPASFTGGGTTLTMPLGNITKQIALEVFSRRFASADAAVELPANGAYRIVVNPRVSRFEYAYNQLKNIGFAITPEVQLDLDVKLFDAGGAQVLAKTYESGIRSGDSYMVSGSPAEKINQAMHRALFALMEQAADDTVAALDGLPARTAASVTAPTPPAADSDR
ncbi:MAG: hypothetical protein QNJ91_18395 [Gammaproteobacteria bacterium]|nr:hypothetical protein [Gammaproteobacteria bacterium]